ncbi:MAG TPA: DUF4386 domain-containing protein [Streptosporangiaceae bacterium]|nr:DUF4386 domain-containing protein [Streptosporangiaceae bacterium]
MSSGRKTAVVAGVFFIVAAVAAVIGLALYGPVLHDTHYVVRTSGGDGRVLAGAICEILLVISVIGTAVTLYPVVRREHEGLAIGYVAGRTVEALVIITGIISLLSVVTLRQDLAGARGADPGALVTVSQALVAVHDWTFLIGPGMAIGVNTLLLATLMYRSRLVPRAIAIIGLAGGPLVFLAAFGVLLGAWTQLSLAGSLPAVPVAVWEMSLAVWMIVKGFRRSPAAVGARPAAGPGPAPDPDPALCGA